MWNNAFDFIMRIKQDYINHKIAETGNDFFELDTYSIEKMCRCLNKKEYNEFLAQVNINVFGEFNLFKYDIAGKDIYNNPNSIFREMRSLVVNIKTNEIVLSPYRKFFNINELPKTNLSIITERIKHAINVEITDKLDGSMQSARWYQNNVFMSGSQALDMSKSFRLKEGYEWITAQNNYLCMLKNYPQLTFIFEYISLKDTHVVHYTEEQQGLYLTGIRDIHTGFLYPYSTVLRIAKDYNVKTVKMDIRPLNEILKDTKTYKATEKEGWVIYVDGIQYKLKCEDYITLHKVIMTNNSHNQVYDAIKNGTFDDMLSKVPDILKENVMKIANNINEYYFTVSNEVNTYYNNIPNTEDKKEFALYVQNNIPKKYQGFVFNMRKGYKNNYFKGVSYQDILNWKKERIL